MRSYVLCMCLLLGLSGAVAAQVIGPPDDRSVTAPPLMRAEGAERPIALESAQVEVEVNGGLAQTTVELVFRNPNARPLEGSLQSLLARPAEAAQLQVEQHDLTADRMLERPTRVALTPEKLDALLQTLRPARTVLLDGRPVAVADEVVRTGCFAIATIRRMDCRHIQEQEQRVRLGCGANPLGGQAELVFGAHRGFGPEGR